MTVVGQTCPVGAYPTSVGFGSFCSPGSPTLQKQHPSPPLMGAKTPPWQLRKMQTIQQSPPAHRASTRDKSQRSKRTDPRLAAPKRTWECPLCNHIGNPSNKPNCCNCGEQSRALALTFASLSRQSDAQPPPSAEAPASTTPKNEESNRMQDEIAYYHKVISQLQSMGDPAGIVPTLTTRINDIQSKLTSELPLVEQLAVASDAHTLALNTLTKRQAQTALAQRFFLEAQQRQSLAEAELKGAKAALDNLNAALAKEATIKQAPIPPSMDMPSLITKLACQAQLPPHDMQALYAFLQQTASSLGPPVMDSASLQPSAVPVVCSPQVPIVGPMTHQLPMGAVPCHAVPTHMTMPCHVVGPAMAPNQTTAHATGFVPATSPASDTAHAQAIHFQFNAGATEWSPEAHQFAMTQMAQSGAPVVSIPLDSGSTASSASNQSTCWPSASKRPNVNLEAQVDSKLDSALVAQSLAGELAVSTPQVPTHMDSA